MGPTCICDCVTVISARVNNFVGYVRHAAPNKYVAMCSFLAIAMFISFGYDSVTTTVSIDDMRKDLKLSQAQVESIPYIVRTCAIVGAIGGGIASDFVGRRGGIIIGGVTHCCRVLATCLATNFGLTVAGRSFIGLGIGFFITAGPIYLVEIPPPASRGFLIALPQICINLGHIMGYVVYAFPVHRSWRVVVALGAIPSSITIVLVWLLLHDRSNTPSWLVRKGRTGEATAVVQNCTNSQLEKTAVLEHLMVADGIETDPLGPEVPIPWHLRPTQIVLEDILRGRNAFLFTSVVIINLLQPGSGESLLPVVSPFFLAYPRIFSYSKQLRVTGGILASKVALMGVWSMFFDRFGSRTLCLTTVGGIIILQITLGIVQLALDHQRLGSAVGDGISYTCLMTILALFSCGLGPIAWTHAPEFLQFRLRAQGTSIGVATNLIARFVVEMWGFKYYITAGGSLFLAFAGFMAVAFPFSYRLMTETRGRFVDDSDDQEIEGNPFPT